MPFHWIKIRTFVHATESRKKVEQAFRFISGNNVDITITKTEGYYGNLIEVLEATLKNKKEIESFWRLIIAAVREEEGDSNSLKDEDFVIPDFLSEADIEKRTDDDCTFYLRLDKQAAFNRKVIPVLHDDAIIVRTKIKSYPANKNNAIELFTKYISTI
jgi:RNA binding exosome subunit